MVSTRQKEEILDKIVRYFKGNDWQNFLSLLKDPPEEVYHVHFWVENAIEAHSLVNLLDKYLKSIGFEVDRKIDLMSGPGGPAGVHCVHPCGGQDRWTLTFDMFWHFNAESVLAPSPSERGEMGKSFVCWGKSYIEQFYKKFQFTVVGPSQEKEIRRYFASRHWKEVLRHITDFNITHMHANVEISIPPDVLRLYAINAFKQAGFAVQWTFPCVFHVKEGYRGKIVFLMIYPEVVWDIAWKYNSQVVIRPSQEVFIFDTIHPGFDISTVDLLEEVLAKDRYIDLSEDEIERVVEMATK
ncbi:hypothetical protein CVT91_01985 [Candidatus Atribacteria bacterium HGW-Atribacteria-1]|nr:MAG: hypothetical protein CVT91_01985 [Candidatus Atribacteria bacterium HGW-Atribacteria-1]